MKKYRNRQDTERLTDVVSYRISSATRGCLEKYADENRVGLCAAARDLLNAGIKARGLTA